MTHESSYTSHFSCTDNTIRVKKKHIFSWHHWTSSSPCLISCFFVVSFFRKARPSHLFLFAECTDASKPSHTVTENRHSMLSQHSPLTKSLLIQGFLKPISQHDLVLWKLLCHLIVNYSGKALFDFLFSNHHRKNKCESSKTRLQ